MCGISGIISTSGCKKSLIYSMTSYLNHRGPDQKNHWIDSNNQVMFGHNRLSILDLSINGLQPMISSSKRYIITFNGEIYNHLYLRKKLKFNSWKSTSDTETLLEFISEFGIDKTLDSIDGMFAFALWDQENKNLTLVRDRAGEKPLYYGFIGNLFIFSSELHGIKKNFRNKLEIDINSINLFLKKGYIPFPRSIFKQIKKLEPGFYFQTNLQNMKNFKKIKYFDLNRINENKLIDKKQINYDDIKDKTLELLNLSVKKQMISDAPIGAFLSSGVDSSIISAIMQKNSSKKINTFTIGFANKEFDETPIAKKISDYLGTNHEEIIFDKTQLLSIVPKINQIYDEPFADSSQIPSTLLSSLASKKVKVCLSGDGADELFGGYQRYKVVDDFIRMSNFLKIPLYILFRLLKNNSILEVLRFIDKLNPSLLNFPIQNQKMSKMYNLLKSDKDSAYLNLMNNFIENENLLQNNIKTQENDLYKINSNSKNFMFIDFMDYLPNDILCKTDRASMYNSLETRAPFLDHHLILYSQQIPLNYKISKNGSKLVLKDIQKQLIPENLCNNKKIGFGVPLQSWLKNDLKDWAMDLIHDKNLKNQNIFNQTSVINRLSEFNNGNYSLTYSIWYICILQSWLNDFFYK